MDINRLFSSQEVSFISWLGCGVFILERKKIIMMIYHLVKCQTARQASYIENRQCTFTQYCYNDF